MALSDKIIGEITTVNEEILDRAIRHSLYLQRYKTSEVNAILDLLNKDVFPDLIHTISDRLEMIAGQGFDKAVWTSGRYKEMLGSINTILSGGMTGAYGVARDDLIGLALHEATWQASAMKSAVPVAMDFITPSPVLLKSIVTSKPMEGAILKEWFEKLADGTQTKVVSEINKGLAEGEAVDDIVRRLKGSRAEKYLDGVLQTSRRGVEATVRTAVNHVSTHAREDTYAANTDVIKGIQIVATLDSRTTPICIDQDGQVYPVGEGWRPPGHWNCRTTTVPVLKSFEELGLPGLKELPESTRASMDGQVPESLTYTDWLKKQTPEFQNEALGPGKATLFREGKIKNFTDNGHTLTLKELKEIEGL